MESLTSSLVPTKLRQPATRMRSVRRSRLVEKLALETVTDLVLICAPAGYGKTTLLVEWSQRLRQAGTQVAWYSLDESDNKLLAFGSYLIASLEQALGPGSGFGRIGQVLRVSPELDLMGLMAAAIQEVGTSSSRMVLVFDDYHLIRAPGIHQAVEFLIAHRPENLHLAIGSRIDPPLPLARLRARGRLIEVRVPELRFTEEETGQFLRDTLQLDLPAGLPSRLAGQVEGWAAGLQLLALSLAGRSASEDLLSSLTGHHRYLREYLLEEVINQLPEALQSFLLYTSILERLSAPLCDAILGRQDSAAWIEQLEQANLFLVPLDEDGAWFRYHHLFRDFLRAWLVRTQPDQALALHRSAADWFAGQGLLREAADHAFRCQDWSFAADFVEQHSFTLIVRSEIAAIYEWCSAFPEPVMSSRPKLCVFQALALAYRFQNRNRGRVEARLHQANQALAASQDPDLRLEAGELAGFVQTFLAMIPTPEVDGRRLLDLSESRLAAFPLGHPGRFPWLLNAGYGYLALSSPGEAAAAFEESLPLAMQSGWFFGLVEVTFHRAQLACSQGKLAEALEISLGGKESLAAAAAQAGVPLPALGCLEVAAGRVLLEQGNLEEAGRRLRLGLEQMGWGMNPYYLLVAYLAQFRLFELSGQLADALTCLEELDSLWPDVQFLTEGLRARARFQLSPQDPTAVQAARAWLQAYGYGRRLGEGLPVRGLGPVGAGEASYQADLAWLGLQIVAGQPEIFPQVLQSPLHLSQERGLRGREIELRLAAAQAFYRSGQEQQALAELETALCLAQPAGYLTVFNQSAVLDELIQLAARQGIAPGCLDPILAALRSSRGGEAQAGSDGKKEDRKPGGILVEPLSERELDVLRLVASGATNQEIAGRLVITVGTVKSHINHILGKLGAGNRTEAVAKARDLGLLDED